MERFPTWGHIHIYIHIYIYNDYSWIPYRWLYIYIYETRPHPSKKMMILRCILPRLYLDDCIYINASSGLGLWSYLIDHGVSLGLH